MPSVSILVAIYNAADTLPRCLDSLLAQTLTDIQIICIDDASTDDSPAVLARYAMADSRITTLRLTENGGQAHARNCGLPLAEGAFIGMVDADDWLAPDALEQAWQVITRHPQTDAVLFDLIKVWPDGKEERYNMQSSEQAWTGHEAMRLSLRWQIHGLYPRLHYLHSREVRTSGGRYYYFQNPRSTTQRVSVLYFESLRAQHHMQQLLADEHIAPDIISDYEQYRWLNVVDCCYYLALHHKFFTAAERRKAREAIAAAYATFPSHWNSPRKFGYRPCGNFRRFWLQEQLYFALRRVTGRL